MKSQVVIYPPNRPLERIMKPSQTPVLYEHLFFVDVNNGGEIILGGSNVAGTFWEASLIHYKNISDAMDNSYLGYFISNSTTSDAKILKNTGAVLLAEDSGALRLLSIPNTNTKQPMSCLDIFEKSDRVEQISLWNSINKAATCSERCISLYDLTNGSSIQFNKKYENYHTDSLTSIDCNNSEPNIFASTSVDRRICIWDDRVEIAASVLYTNEFCTLTSVSWNPVCPSQLVVGSEAGDIYLLDTKQPKEFLTVKSCFEGSIHRVLFNALGNLAVCGDSPTVLVYTAKNNELVKFYESNEHSAIVRGLAWFKEDLYSCGFDKKILNHVFYLKSIKN